MTKKQLKPRSGYFIIKSKESGEMKIVKIKNLKVSVIKYDGIDAW